MTGALLVDTSAWIDHLKGRTDKVEQAGQDRQIELVAHPMVLTELLLGGMPKDAEAMRSLRELRVLRTASAPELTEFIEKRGIQGKGIGYVDASLLASCVLDGAGLLSLDRRLNGLAQELGVNIY